jgi:type I restriction enzyme, R subunit
MMTTLVVNVNAAVVTLGSPPHRTLSSHSEPVGAYKATGWSVSGKNSVVTASIYGPLEEETCRQFVLPALESAGWTDEQVKPQYRINRGRIRATARLHRQDHPLIADYVLQYSDGLPVAVIEAKRSRRDPADGFEQAKRYAQLLDVPFAYATNGLRTLELDTRAGRISEIRQFPSPQELWRRFKDDREIVDPAQERLATASLGPRLRNWDGTPKEARYYQQIAINRAVQAVGRGDKRLLLVLATGTGKTLVAAQIVAKLWNSRWPEGSRPRVLYLADRNILLDQAKDDYFQKMFGEAVHKLSRHDFTTSRHIYFALYQSLDGGPEDEAKLYRQFDPDFFDLVIVDECHRSSATEGSQWREILKYFKSATQIGLTATPVSRKDTDTYQYFGEPLFEYSLARGIEDGFLAPYRVRRVRMNVDMTGWRPSPGQLDRYGREIPDKLYGPREYERLLAILERTDEAARYLTEYLYRTGRMAKTIVFCQDAEHAMRMATALTNQNADLVRQYGPTYACRITSKDEAAGREWLDEFRQVDTQVPVIAVTAQMLSTGVDIPTLQNIVIFRRITSMPEFKQIIGRGTRLFPPDKFSFDIIDFVEATRLFNDPLFDGPPMRLIRDYTDEDGHIQDTVDHTRDLDQESVAEPGGEYTEEPGGSLPEAVQGQEDEGDADEEEIRASPRKFFVDGVEVVPWGTAFYVYDPEAGGLQLREFGQFIRDRLISLQLDPNQLRTQWARTRTRKELRDRLDDWHIATHDLAEWAGQQDADTIDLLLYVGWEIPVLSRAERTRRVQMREQDFLDSFAPEARQVLEKILGQYAARGADELDISALKSQAYRPLGTVVQIADRFGGDDSLRSAIDKLSELIYAAV